MLCRLLDFLFSSDQPFSVYSVYSVRECVAFFRNSFFRIIGTDCYLFFFSFSISTQQWYEHWTFTMYMYRFRTRRYSLGFDVMCVFSISFCSNLFLLLLFFSYVSFCVEFLLNRLLFDRLELMHCICRFGLSTANYWTIISNGNMREKLSGLGSVCVFYIIRFQWVLSSSGLSTFNDTIQHTMDVETICLLFHSSGPDDSDYDLFVNILYLWCENVCVHVILFRFTIEKSTSMVHRQRSCR